MHLLALPTLPLTRLYTKGLTEALDGWIGRRLRACPWKQWKRVRTRFRELRRLPIPEWVARELASTRKGLWRLTKVLSNGLGKAYWSDLGPVRLGERYARLRHA
ncbi:MAG: group II intron maturase-specific domain-containing protein [Bacillota bacterium]